MANEFENVQRGNIFIWFLFLMTFLIFIVIRLIKNQVDIKDGGK